MYFIVATCGFVLAVVALLILASVLEKRDARKSEEESRSTRYIANAIRDFLVNDLEVQMTIQTQEIRRKDGNFVGQFMFCEAFSIQIESKRLLLRHCYPQRTDPSSKEFSGTLSIDELEDFTKEIAKALREHSNWLDSQQVEHLDRISRYGEQLSDESSSDQGGSQAGSATFSEP